jgi:predicted regulator of Ras-like GTPase activity (Roadblock/LC7/MglB family)
MDAALADIANVAGVAGVFLCRSNGQVLAGSLKGVDHELLGSIGRTFGRTLEGLRIARKKKVADLDLLYESGRLLVKNLGDAYLVISCAPTINVPLLNLTANLAAKKIAASLKALPTAADAPRPQAIAAAPPPAASGTPLAVGLRTIAEQHMGEAGAKLFVRELAGAGLGVQATLDQLARWLPGFDYTAQTTTNPALAREMIAKMRSFLEQHAG